MKHETLAVINENDEVIAGIKYDVVHRDRLKHRTVSTLVLSADGERMLLAQKLPTSESEQNTWHAASTGHVQFGQTYTKAAEEELSEELFESKSLPEWINIVPAGKCWNLKKPDNQEMTAVFTITCPPGKEECFTGDQNEIQQLKWWTVNEIRKQTISNPERFTITFCTIFDAWCKKANGEASSLMPLNDS